VKSLGLGVWGSRVAVVVGVIVAGSIFVAQACALPSERHYEQVSPLYKGGFGALRVSAVSPTGDSVGFYSPGNFVGAPSGPILGPDYFARRTESGWSSVSLVPPAAMIAEKVNFDLDPSLSFMLLVGDPGTSGQNPFNETDFLLHATDEPDIEGAWESAGALTALGGENITLQYEGASDDFCHFAVVGTGPVGQFVPEAVGVSTKELYDVSRGCGGSERSVSLVGLNNEDKMINRLCDARLGNDGYGLTAPGQFNAVSEDGSEIFFTVCTINKPVARFGPQVPHQVFVRLGGSRTLEISRPLVPGCEARGIVGEVPCRGAEGRASSDFQGASEDGSRVYFTASLANGQSPLVPGDEDMSNNLYVAGIGCPVSSPACASSEREVTSLSEVSHDPNGGQAADVLGVTRIAPDGSRAYFVAEGDLLTQPQKQALEAEGRAVPRDDAANLYAYDDHSKTVAFIGDLCSGSFASGAIEDVHCPGGGSDERLWNVTPEETYAQTSGTDGRFFVFTTDAQLVANDVNAASDVYRYDAATGGLQRVSVGEAGFDDDGNRTVLGPSGEVLGASILPGHYNGLLLEEHGLGVRAVSEDGSRIVFVSAEPLSPMAANGLDNAYEWHEASPRDEMGEVSLISSGEGSQPVSDVTVSPDGSGVFFVTVEGLVPQDTDGLPDVYDARLGEGFTQPPAVRHPCEGDACQGPLTNPAPLLVPGSVSQTPGGNFVSAQPTVKTVKAKKKRKQIKKKRKPSRRDKKTIRTKAHSTKRTVSGRGR
jgi:hypothetical protein